MKYVVMQTREADTDHPIKLRAGDLVKCVESSDPDGDWAGWVYCKTKDQEGWVPMQIIDEDGENGVVTTDYDATELSIEAGEQVIGTRELNGWTWGYKIGEPSKVGWIPLNHIQAEA